MDTYNFVLSCSEGKVGDEHTDLNNLDTQDHTNKKVPGKLKHEFGSKTIEEFVTLSPKTNIFKYCGKNRAKEKGIKKCNNAKQEDQ